MSIFKRSDDSDDNNIEQSFFQLAYAQLQDKLPKLLTSLIGFEIVKKDEDGTKAVGVFGFKSEEGKILFVPVFFINGSVKGMDMIYAKDSEQFFPLNEDYAELLLGHDSMDAGRTADETKQQIQQDMGSLDMRNMVVPPRTGKYTYASCIDYVKGADNLTKKAFKDQLEKNADFFEAMLSFYPLEKIADALVEKELPGKKYREDGPVKILNEGETFDDKSLDEAQKEQLATEGFLVIDKRAPEQKSKFAPVNLTLSFTNPTDSGFYPYLTQTGEIRFALILMKPIQLGLPYATDDAIVVDLDSANKGQAYLVEDTKIFAKNAIVVSDYSEIYKKFENPADVKPSNETYVLINEKLKSSQPFKVVANYKDASGVRRLHVEPVRDYNIPRDDLDGGFKRTGNRPGSVHNLPDGNFYTKPHKLNNIFLAMTKTIGDKFTYKEKNVYVPAGFKLLRIELSKPYEKEQLAAWERGKPGTTLALNVALGERNVYPMTIHNNGSEYFVNVKDVKKTFKDNRIAKISMVTQYGLDYKEACNLIDGILPTYKVKGYLKVADLGSYPAQPIEEQPYQDEFGTPTYAGVPTENQAPIDHTYTGLPTQMGLGVKPDSATTGGIDGEIDKATSMAQHGQKEIFDSHTIATLAKYVNPGDKVTEYTPTLLAALDKLGRLLFLTHWEIEKFTEMYGRDDLPKFVELLTDVFKNLGDTIIFLKRKSPELTINMSHQDGLDI